MDITNTVLVIEWTTSPTSEKRGSGPYERTTTQERRKPGEGAEPGENFSFLVLNLTLIVEVLGVKKLVWPVLRLLN